MDLAVEKERIRKLHEERDRLRAKANLLALQKEEASKKLETLKARCAEIGLDPDRLEESLVKLEARYEEQVSKFEADLAAARDALSPYL